jgi:heavy metal sensor kinase
LFYTLEARLISEVDSRITNFAKFLAAPDTTPRPPDAFRGGMRWRHMPRRPNDEFPPAVLDVQGYLLNGDGSKGIVDRRGFVLALIGQYDIRSATVKGVPARVCSFPMVRNGHIVGVVQVARSLENIYGEMRLLRRTVLIISPFALLLAGLFGAFLTGRALRPVRDFSLAATRISADDFDRRLPVVGRDEFAQLASTFNGTLDRLQDAFGRLEDSLEQQRRLTADASHELRTPLTVIKAHTSLSLSSKRTAAQYINTLTAVDQAADIMSRIVQDLLLLARADAGQLTVQNDQVLLSEAIGMALDAASSLEGPEITTVSQCDSLRVPGDVHLLARVFTNILSNAKRHTPPSGQVTMSIRREGGNVVVSVTDTGEGIPADALPHIGERFYRVDTARARSKGGTGLGLAICRSIIAAHGGQIAITSSPGEGAQVTVRLPCS